MYDSIISEQCEIGIIEKVDRNYADRIKHYISHHVVVQPDNSTTKLHFVYNASSKMRTGRVFPKIFHLGDSMSPLFTF